MEHLLYKQHIVVNVLIKDARFDVHHQDNDGNTVLHYFNWFAKNIQCLKLLLCSGRNIDINIKNKRGETEKDKYIKRNMQK